MEVKGLHESISKAASLGVVDDLSETSAAELNGLPPLVPTTPVSLSGSIQDHTYKKKSPLGSHAWNEIWLPPGEESRRKGLSISHALKQDLLWRRMSLKAAAIFPIRQLFSVPISKFMLKHERSWTERSTSYSLIALRALATAASRSGRSRTKVLNVIDPENTRLINNVCTVSPARRR